MSTDTGGSCGKGLRGPAQLSVPELGSRELQGEGTHPIPPFLELSHA